MSRLHLIVMVAACAAGLPAPAAAQDHWLRDRLKGEWRLGPVICFCPPVGLKEVVELTQLTVEGVVLRADSALGQWRPFGVFTVRDGRVIHLESRLHVPDYESVAQFARALADPPPTPQR